MPFAAQSVLRRSLTVGALPSWPEQSTEDEPISALGAPSDIGEDNELKDASTTATNIYSSICCPAPSPMRQCYATACSFGPRNLPTCPTPSPLRATHGLTTHPSLVRHAGYSHDPTRLPGTDAFSLLAAVPPMGAAGADTGAVPSAGNSQHASNASSASTPRGTSKWPSFSPMHSPGYHKVYTQAQANGKGAHRTSPFQRGTLPSSSSIYPPPSPMAMLTHGPSHGALFPYIAFRLPRPGDGSSFAPSPTGSAAPSSAWNAQLPSQLQALLQPAGGGGSKRRPTGDEGNADADVHGGGGTVGGSDAQAQSLMGDLMHLLHLDGKNGDGGAWAGVDGRHGVAAEPAEKDEQAGVEGFQDLECSAHAAAPVPRTVTEGPLAAAAAAASSSRITRPASGPCTTASAAGAGQGGIGATSCLRFGSPPWSRAAAQIPLVPGLLPTVSMPHQGFVEPVPEGPYCQYAGGAAAVAAAAAAAMPVRGSRQSAAPAGPFELDTAHLQAGGTAGMVAPGHGDDSAAAVAAGISNSGIWHGRMHSVFELPEAVAGPLGAAAAFPETVAGPLGAAANLSIGTGNSTGSAYGGLPDEGCSTGSTVLPPLGSVRLTNWDTSGEGNNECTVGSTIPYTAVVQADSGVGSTEMGMAGGMGGTDAEHMGAIRRIRRVWSDLYRFNSSGEIGAC